MTYLTKIFDLGIKPKKKKKKQIHLNNQEKAMKRKLANLLMVNTFKGYRYFFSYQHDNDIHECGNVNEFIKSITHKECYTERDYTVTAYSILGDGYQSSLINVNDLKGGK